MFHRDRPYGPTHQPLAGMPPLVRFCEAFTFALVLASMLSSAYVVKPKPKPATQPWRGQLTGVDYVHLVKELGPGGVDEIQWRLPFHRDERFYPSLKRMPVATWEVRFYYSGRVEVVGDHSAMRVQFWDQFDLCQEPTGYDSAVYIQGPTEPTTPHVDGYFSAKVSWSLAIRPREPRAARLAIHGEPPAEIQAFWTEMVELMPPCYATGPENAPVRLRR